MIKINNLSFSYDNKNNIINNITLSIEENKFISIIGENGTGKSTLAKLISGIIYPNKGTITIDELNITDNNNIFEIRKKVALIMPNPEWQLIGSVVEEEISSGLFNLNYSTQKIKKEVQEISELLEINHLLDKTTDELSGGEKQIVNLASVLVMKPKYLILDEPISMLDKYNQNIVIDFFYKLKKFNISIIFISHSIKEVITTDSIIGLKNGKVRHNNISVDTFINENIYQEYDFNLNFELTLNKYLSKI